jgi:predicted phosphodiesterase
MKILLLGDVHGQMAILRDVLRNARPFGVEIAIQVGDFGFFPLVFENHLCLPRPFDIPVYAIDGNHENHAWIYKQDWNKWSKDLNLNFMPRATVKEIGGITVAFLGGALNIDRFQTAKPDDRLYFYDNRGIHNFTTTIEKDALVEALNLLDKPIDIMVTHTCPHSIGVGMMKNPQLNYLEERFVTTLGVNTGPDFDCGEQILTDLWTELKFKPLHWIFGHFHKRFQTTVENTKFTCVGCTDDSDGRQYVTPFIFDTETKDIEVYLDKVI